MAEQIKNITYETPLDQDDLNIVGLGTSRNIGFGDSPNKESTELHVYDLLTDEYIDSAYDLPNVTYDTINGETIFYADIEEHLRGNGFKQGSYRVAYNFLKSFIENSGLWYVKDISTSRTEIRVGPSQEFNLEENGITRELLAKLVADMSTSNNPHARLVLNFGKDRVYLVINQTVSGNSLVFKLYKPLPEEIVDKMEVIPMIEVANSISLEIALSDADAGEIPLNILTGPNTNVKVSRYYEAGTAYQSWDDLLSTNAQTSKDLIDHYLSSSKWETTINIDYSNFNNFVFFSSAEERVKNFQYKLTLLETYSSSIAALTSSVAYAAGQVTASINYFQNLQRRIVNGFDGYERWLYEGSGSIYSSSLGFGEVTQSTWPKTSGSSSPFTSDEQEKTNSAIAVTWYNNEILEAQDYDMNNPYKLTNTAPMHIQEDDANSAYMLFLEMIGQHFDNMWTYIKNFNQKYDLQHKLDEGTAKDVIWATLKTFGLDLTNGADVQSLWRYAFGTDVSGSYGNNVYKMSYEDATKEVWKRLLNNLPYLLKTKGTERGVRALITSYGIPATVLRIREYGGPDPTQNYTDTTFIREVFTYLLDFDGTQKVSGSWNNFGGSRKPDSIEVRFKLQPGDKTDASQSLFSLDTPASASVGLNISLVPTSSQYSQSTSDYGGYVSIAYQNTTTRYENTPVAPLWNGDWWSLLFTREAPWMIFPQDYTYTLTIKQAFNDRITQVVSTSAFFPNANALSHSYATAWDTASVFTIGEDTLLSNDSLVGSVQELRFWRNILDESVFNNHVLAPTAYNGNTYTSSYYDLVLRYRFNQKEFYTSGSYSSLMLDSNPSQGSVNHGYWSGSTSASIFASQDDRNIFLSPNLGSRRWTSNKVRVDNYISMSGNLDRKRRVTVSRYDNAPLDSKNLGIYLSPQDIVNDDIIRVYADFNIDNFIGSPTDWYGDSYPELTRAREIYWSKYATVPNMFTYLRVLTYFDKSLFEQIQKMVPARANLQTGYLIEQNFLERPKTFFTRKPFDPSYDTYTASISLNDYISESADTTLLDAEVDVMAEWLTLFGNNEAIYDSNSIQVPAPSSSYSYPIIVFSGSVTNDVLTITDSAFVWEPTGAQALPASDFWLDSGSFTPVCGSNGAITGYSGSHYIFHRDYFTSKQNQLFNGCRNTIYTTVDKGLPFEIFEGPSTRLVVVNSSINRPPLKVE